MLTIFVHSLRRSLGAILGWGLSLALLGFYLLTFYDTMAAQQAQLEQLIQQYPPELMAFFGGTVGLFAPEGYLSLEFFSYMPLVIGIYAVLAGSGLLVSDEEAGILDLILSHPISRTAFFSGRLLAFAATLATILGMTWLAFLGGVTQSEKLDLSAIELLRPFLTLYAVLFLFGSLSLLLSMFMPSRGSAAMVAGLLLVASYFIDSLSKIDKDLESIARYLPLRYYQSGHAINGLEGEWLLGLFGFGLLFALLAWWRFQRRDIRVSGEGTWRMPFKIPPKNKRTAA